MAGSVIITGNHYLVDVVVGDGLAFLALTVVRAYAARHQSAPMPQIVAAPEPRAEVPVTA